jgi:hypothetical protein
MSIIMLVLFVLNQRILGLLVINGPSPINNPTIEIKNRTLIDLVDAMLDTTGLSKEWWGEAILTACHVLN